MAMPLDEARNDEVAAQVTDDRARGDPLLAGLEETGDPLAFDEHRHVGHRLRARPVNHGHAGQRERLALCARSGWPTADQADRDDDWRNPARRRWRAQASEWLLNFHDILRCSDVWSQVPRIRSIFQTPSG
jgi:hypothetical protein